MKNFSIPVSFALIVCLSSCTALSGALGGAAVGGGTGFGVARATGANNTGTALMTVGGAVVGGVIGHEVGKNQQNEADWKVLQKESKKASEINRFPQPDGTTLNVQVFLHTPTDQYWDHVVQYSAPNGNTPPKIIGEWAKNWRQKS